MKVVVTGVRGFVGGLLTPELLKRGHEVVGISRTSEPAPHGVRIVRGDIAQDTAWHEALEGADVAYYLVHSFERQNREGFASRDRRAARAFADRARQAGVRRIVFLGVSDASGTSAGSPHRRSRREVESILLATIPGSVSLRTWMITSPRNQFVRFLARLIRDRPVLVLPPSRRFRFRPVDGRDVAVALATAADEDDLSGRVVDLAGPTTTTTEDFTLRLMRRMGYARRVLRLPVAPPDFLLASLIRAAEQDPAMLLPVFESARGGDVLPDGAALLQLVPTPHGLDASLDYAVRVIAEEAS